MKIKTVMLILNGDDLKLRKLVPKKKRAKFDTYTTVLF